MYCIRPIKAVLRAIPAAPSPSHGTRPSLRYRPLPRRTASPRATATPRSHRTALPRKPSRCPPPRSHRAARRRPRRRRHHRSGRALLASILVAAATTTDPGERCSPASSYPAPPSAIRASAGASTPTNTWPASRTASASVEKPFGRDSESKGELARSMKRYLAEQQIFR